MEVSSHFEGRVRVRDAGLKQEPLLAKAREALLALPGVSEVEANPRVGSLLVLYSAAVTAAGKILRALSEVLGVEEPAESADAPGETAGRAGATLGSTLGKTLGSTLAKTLGKITPKGPFTVPGILKKRIVNNIGMLVSLGLSLGAAALYFKKIHILAGIVFVGFFGIHLFERRKMVFA
jgi:hypothetical protein